MANGIMILRRLGFIGTLLLGVLSHSDAQFGINKDIGTARKETSGMLEDDPELLAAIDIFATMNADERRELLKEVSDMFGDDPETLALLEQVVDDVANVPESEIETSLKDLVDEDEVTVAMADTMKLLANADEGSWEMILANKEKILEAVIQSGQISEEDAGRFQSDSAAWENELNFIWQELKKNAHSGL